MSHFFLLVTISVPLSKVQYKYESKYIISQMKYNLIQELLAMLVIITVLSLTILLVFYV